MPPASPITLDSPSGAFQAQIFPDTGRIALAGPNLAGAPLASVVALEPVEVTLAGHAVTLGRVVGAPRMTATSLEVDQDLGGAKATTRVTFPAEGVMRFEVRSWGGPKPQSARIVAKSDSSEHFFGFGERFNPLDQARRLVRIQTQDHPGDKFTPNHPENSDFAYKVTPWFLSSHGYGFHLDSAVESTFDMRKTKTDRYIVSQPFIPDRPAGLALHLVGGPKLTDALSRYTGLSGRPPLPPPWAFGPWISSDVWRNGGEVRYVVEKFLERDIPASAFVFDSPWEFAYNDFTFNIPGESPRDGNTPPPAVTQFGSKGRFENQPGEAFHTFDEFQSLAAMMTFFQAHGLKVICWMTPFINDDSTHDERAGAENTKIEGQLSKAPNFQDGVAKGVFVGSETDDSHGSHRTGIHWWKGHGRHIDFTKPAARDWLKDQLVSLIDKSRVPTRSGGTEPAICGIKTDDAEALAPGAGSNGNPDGVYLSPDAKYFDPGVTAEEMRNRYSVGYHKTVYTILRDAVGPAGGLIFSRSGFHGSQAFPGGWPGDNEPNFTEANGLPSVIRAGLSAALSGFSIWGHDIGGYQQSYEPSPTDIDLFMRWTQFGCFTPIMQMHRQLSPPPPHVSHPHGQYPWGYVSNAERADPALDGKEFTDNAALRNYRFYAKLHTRLFPYIYTYAKESSATGLPIMRPLVLLHQDDPTTFGVNHTYYFGNELLVAPVIQPNRTGRTVYLPRGRWVDFWTNELVDRDGRGDDFDWSNPDTDPPKLPVFAREGSIIPMLLEVPQTLCDANYVNNGQIRTPGDGLLFRIYPAGMFRFTVFDGTDVTCRADGGGVTVTITSPKPRPVQLEVRGPRPSSGVRRDGTTLDEKTDPAQYAAAGSAWRHDPTPGPGFLTIKFPHGGGSTAVTF